MTTVRLQETSARCDADPGLLCAASPFRADARGEDEVSPHGRFAFLALGTTASGASSDAMIGR